MPHMDKMALKAFWDTVEQRLAKYSAEELRAILRALAQEVAPTGRQAFLDKLKPAAEAAAAVRKAIGQEDLLADIDDLAREIKERTKNAEYWEEDKYEWGDDYEEEESLGPYEEFVEPLTALFDRAEAAFDYGNLALARKAYQKLFQVFESEDEYGRGVSADDLTDVDIDEARARHLRAVYETKSLAQRPQALFEQMQQMRPSHVRAHVMLDDIMQISRKPLPDQEEFLKAWIAFLRKQRGSDADAWLREAIRLAQGTQGLEQLARAEGKKRPRAYLDWFAALESEGKHHQVLSAAQEALQVLPDKLPIRAAIADHLCAAAVKLNDSQALRAGRWEAFIAKPTLERLLDVWDSAPKGEAQTRLMQQAAQHVKEYLAHPPRSQEALDKMWSGDDLEMPAWIDASVLAHAYLLAEDWDAAHQLAAHEQVLGWSGSDNPQGLVVPFFLMLLSGLQSDQLPRNLELVWEVALQNSIGFGYGGEDKEEKGTFQRLKRAYAEKLTTVSLSRERQAGLLTWCLDVSKRRVNAIVGDQHRGSYGKAATLIAACAEVLQSRGNAPEADAILEDVRNRFPRHRSFQAELSAATDEMKRRRR